MFDFVVIGGGIVGCSVLNKLTRKNQKVLLIESGLDVSTGCSKANSGLCHAGFDCKPGTLKARFNVRGNELLYKLCPELFVPIRNCGALVVGSDLKKVQELYDRGIENNVPKMEILDRTELIKMVPNLQDNITCGLYAKTAGVFSPYMYTIALAEEAVINGAEVLFDTKIDKVEYVDNVYNLYQNNKLVAKTKNVINASGFGFNDVSKLFGAETYEIEFKRGEYFLLDQSVGNFVNHTVFPLPSVGSKGVVVTPTIDGNLIIGPTSYVSDLSTETTELGLSSIKEKANSVYKSVPFNKTIRNYAGIRTIVGDDFVVKKSELKPNLINIAGICSPGLTAAPAIAEYVVEELLSLTEQEKVMQKRKPYIMFKHFPTDTKNQFIKDNPDYGKIVCKCEQVSLAEVKQAINSPLKPKSFDAIKRRVRTGMGKCQSGFCLTKVISAIATEHGISEFDVVKENSGSNFYLSEIE